MFRNVFLRVPQQCLRYNQNNCKSLMSKKTMVSRPHNFMNGDVIKSTLPKGDFCLFGKEMKPWQKHVCIGSGVVLGIGLSIGVATGVYYGVRKITFSSFIYYENNIRKHIDDLYPTKGLKLLLIDTFWIGLCATTTKIYSNAIPQMYSNITNMNKSFISELSKNKNCCATIRCTSSNLVSILNNAVLIPISAVGIMLTVLLFSAKSYDMYTKWQDGTYFKK